MTLVQLEYVLAVAENKNFTLAAEKSFVTQPTLSMQIQKLENELNIEIFDRSSQPIKTTKIGQKVVEQAKAILRESKKMQNLVFEEKGQTEGEFRIGIIPTVLPTLVPLFYRTFQKAYPKSNLIIREMQTDEITAALHQDQLDFGIVVTPLHEDQIMENPLYYEPMVGYIPPQHPYHSKNSITTKDLETDDLLLLREGHCFRNNVLNLCSPAKLKSQPVNLDSGSLDTLIKLADEGYGMTLIPLLQAEDLSQNQKKNIRYFSDPPPTREVSLVYIQSNLRKSFVENLTRTIQSVMRGKIYFDKADHVTSPLLSLPK